MDPVAQGYIDLLDSVLEKRLGVGRIFFDKRGMRAGDWAAQLKTNLPEAEAVIVLIGNHDAWLRNITAGDEPAADGEIDDWVKWEVEAALAERIRNPAKLVVPLYLNDPKDFPKGRLPSSMAGLASCQSRYIPINSVHTREQTEAFALWLVRELPKSIQRRDLLRDLKDSLCPQEVQVALTRESTRVWTYFRASIGVLSRYDELAAEVDVNRDLDSDRLLEILDGFQSSLPMLRFLNLMLFHRVKGASLELPAEVTARWKEFLDRKAEGWNLRPEDWDTVTRWVTAEDALRPVFQLILRPDFGSSQRGIRLSGTIRWGQRPADLELVPDWVDWRPGLGTQELFLRFQPVFVHLVREAVQWLGPKDGWTFVESVPRIELFLTTEQSIWPLELVPCPVSETDSESVAGTVFRVIRRLYDRHFGSGRKPDWSDGCGRFTDPVDRDGIHRIQQWADLARPRPKHKAFRCNEPLVRAEFALLEHWVCGVWRVGDESKIDEIDLDDVLTQPLPCEEYARGLNRSDAAVALLLDRLPQVAPIPNDLKRAAERERKEEKENRLDCDH